MAAEPPAQKGRNAETAYVNLVKFTERAGAQLDAADDLLALTAKIKGVDKNLKVLLDIGSTICAINTKLVQEHSSLSDARIDHAKCVVYANSARQTLKYVQPEGIAVIENSTKRNLHVPLLHEMALPKDYDLLLGKTWWQQQKANINWDSKPPTVSFGPKEAPGTVALQVTDTTPGGEISKKQMKRLLRKHPETVGMMHVHARSDRHTESTVTEWPPSQPENSQEAATVAQATTDTLIRRRLEAILQRTEPEKEKEEDAHPSDRPKLFLDQPETGYDSIDAELLRAYENERFTELTADVIKRQTENQNRLKALLAHRINIEPGVTKTPHSPYRRMSHKEQEECKKVIEQYLNTGVIRPSESPYGAAVLFAPKKDGKLRFCVDWRPLNNITVKNSAHPPDAIDCINQLTGAKIFSTIDLSAGYHQLPIVEEDKAKTAFNTKYGHYEFNLMSFGLASAPASFVSAMNRIFSGEMFRTGMGDAQMTAEQKIALAALNPEEKKRLGENYIDDFVCIYIDDIIIYSKDANQHAEHLRKVFDRLHQFDLVVNSKKSFFAQKEVEYLGHIVSEKGVHMNPEKVEAVAKWPTPQTQTDVRQFLGLTNFYRRFIKGHSQIAKPLTDLTKKEMANKDGILKEFSETANNAFETLKTALCTAPVLAIPDPGRGKFHIMCDASTYGLGATLFQEGADDKKLHPVAYVSRVLTATERKRYEQEKCVYDLELKALMFALDKWRVYLDGQIGTTVDTDHKSLIWLATQKELSPTQGQFLDTLARCDLKIKYIKGELNIPGDVLSRNPEFERELAAHICESKDNPEGLVAAATSQPEYADLDAWFARIEKAYEFDESYKGKKAEHPFYLIERDGRSLWYKVHDGNDLPPSLCIPEDQTLRDRIINEHHAPPTIGHRHAQQTYTRIKQSYYWHGMKNEIFETVQRCEVCQKRKRNRNGKFGHMAPQEHPRGPWSSQVLDFSGPYQTPPETNKIKAIKTKNPRQRSQRLKTDRAKAADADRQRPQGSNDQVMVVVCRLTKMAHFVPCKSTQTAEEAADLYFEHVVKHHGIPDELRSDRDKLFTARFWARIWARLGTTVALGTAYRHQTAGQAERVIQDLNIYIGFYITEHHDWEKWLPMAEFAYNSADHASIGCSPFELNKGFRPKTPGDLMSPPVKIARDAAGKQKEKQADDWLEQMRLKIDAAQERLKEAHAATKAQYDKHRKPMRDSDGQIKFAPVGSKVYVSTAEMPNLQTVSENDRKDGHTGELKRKFLPTFIGPYEILRVCGHGDLNRKVALPATLKAKLKGTDVFHVDRLKAAHWNPEKGLSLSDDLPPPTMAAGQGQDAARVNDDEQHFYVERVVAWQDHKNGRQFKVRFKGYDQESDLWYSQEDLPHAKEAIAKFMQTNPRPVVIRPARQQTRAARTRTARAMACMDYSGTRTSLDATAMCYMVVW